MKKFRLMAAAFCAAFLLCGFSVPAYAFSDPGEETTGGVDPAAPTEEAPEPNPFTPDGTGTVVDNATGEEGKEFFTITTADEAVFYLVIDRQKNSENVYFLNAVTVADLEALAELPDEPAVPALEPEPTPDTEPAPEEQSEPEPKTNAGPLLMALAVLLIGGGAAFYFKVYRPKHQQAPAPGEEYEGPDPYEDGEDYGGGEYDDGPPWDEDDDGSAGEEDK
jgi:hypothetical protein